MVHVMALLADLAIDGASIAVFVFFGWYWRSWFYLMYAALAAKSRIDDWRDSREKGK